MGRVWQLVEEAGGQIALRGGKEGREEEQVEATVLLMNPAHHYQASLFFFFLVGFSQKHMPHARVVSCIFIVKIHQRRRKYSLSVCRYQQCVENTPTQVKARFYLSKRTDV